MIPPALRRFRHLAVVALVLIAGHAAAAADPAGSESRLASPDRRLQVVLRWPAAGSQGMPEWSAAFRGRPVLEGCRLALRTVAEGELLAGARPAREDRRAVDLRVPIPFGRADHGNDRFNEARWRVEAPGRPPVDVVFRCYDDAVALRYELPSAAGFGAAVVVADEGTAFVPVGGPRAFVQVLEHHRTSHEHAVDVVRADAIPAGALLDLPLVFAHDDGTTVAVTEAALRRYAGMALVRTVPGGPLECRLTPRPDGNKVVGTRPMRSPWRVALVADRPGALLESTTLHCLNDPTAFRDTSWIRPGKITFPWWNGDVFDGKPGEPILSAAMARKYIDFCASNGIPTHSMTSTEGTVTPWYHQSRPGVEPGPDTDVTRVRDGFDLPGIRAYARSRGVRLWTWVHQAALRGRLEEGFAAMERMGWSGLMVDFFDHDDQDSVEFAEQVLECAGRHHLMVHLHGVWKPTGLERTYPNLMNHEGALNEEYMKWSDRCTPAHDVRMAYTRLVAGPMDYHLGGFRAVAREAFVPRNVGPNVLGTRCHHLALYVCLDNPNPMVADYPTAYADQPGFEFVTRVPTWWDETRVVDGRIGEYLVTARRKRRTWHLGALSGGPAREVDIPLSFLGRGAYRLRLWSDAPETAQDPNRLARTTRTVRSGDRLAVRIAADGGFVAEIAPEGGAPAGLRGR